VHQTIQKVTADIDRIRLNTAVAAFHELVNEAHRLEAEVVKDAASRAVLRETLETLVKLMNPFTPHVCESLWESLGGKASLVFEAWPVADAEAAREDAMELAVQVNGKVRGRITVPRGATEEEVRTEALGEPHVKAHLDGKQIQKFVVVPGRLVSLVVS
jgi:leucyl-tRNA synthetase